MYCTWVEYFLVHCMWVEGCQLENKLGIVTEFQPDNILTFYVIVSTIFFFFYNIIVSTIFLHVSCHVGNMDGEGLSQPRSNVGSPAAMLLDRWLVYRVLPQAGSSSPFLQPVLQKKASLWSNLHHPHSPHDKKLFLIIAKQCCI